MPKKSIPIELGGKTRQLRYDFNALVALEDALDISISEIGKLMSGSVRLKDLRSIVWAGLLHDNEEVTEKEVGGWLELSVLGDVADKVGQAINIAFPDVPGESKNGGSSQIKK